MTLEIFRALTPFITLALVFGMGMVSWLIKRLIGENVLHFHDLKKELKDKIEQKSRIFEKRIDKVEQEIEKLESSRHVDQRYLYERFVSKENFYLSFEKTERSINEIFKQIYELGRMVNQILGVNK
ncbi:MAG: hypothetical protein IIA62_00995 [Nitrospinae bacterium]|nr:hypothetical protein [Nitrospinota bacterium]